MMKNRYILESAADNIWRLLDKDNGILITFNEHQFNETQRVTMLGDKSLAAEDAPRIAKAMAEMADWMSTYHYAIAMPLIDFRQDIGAQIRGARLANRMSIDELSEACGMNKSNISRIENGRYSYGIDVLGRIAQALNKRITLV